MNAMHENLVDEYISKLKETYKYAPFRQLSINNSFRNRAEALMSSLRQFSPIIEWIEPQGGYFLWAKLNGMPSSKLLSIPDPGVTFQPGTRFSVNEPPNFENYLRLCFCFYDEEELKEAGQRLGKMLVSN